MDKIKLDKRYEDDWGASGAQWTGEQVQEFLKEQLMLTIAKINEVVDKVPTLPDGSLEDNQAYVLKNGKFVVGVPKDHSFVLDKKETGASYDLYKSLDKHEVSRLHISVDTDTKKTPFKITGIGDNGMKGYLQIEPGSSYNGYMDFKVTTTSYNGVFRDQLVLPTYDGARYLTFSGWPQNDNTYGVKNGAPELIADNGEAVIAYTLPTAQSLALDAYNKGVLPVISDPDMLEEVKELLGEEMFNELAAKSVQTQELKPQLTFEEKLAKAKAEYEQRKLDQARWEEEMIAMAQKAMETAEEVEAEEVKSEELDVLPKKGKEA